MKKPLGIIIPVYNEAENIRNTLDTIEERIKTLHKMYVVYDFDEDNTLPLVREFLKRGLDIELIKNPLRGVVNAIKVGLQKADEDYLLVTMADFSDDLSKVDEMFIKINEGYDIVCGSRYMKGGKQIGGPWFKKFLSRTAGVSLHHLTGIPSHDVTNSFKMYTKKVLKDITIESNGGFEIGMEIVIKAHFAGFKVTEIPCIWMDRQKGKSRFKITKWTPKYLRWYFYALKRAFFFTQGGISVK